MKKLKLISFVLLLLVGLFACKKDTTPVNQGNENSAVISNVSIKWDISGDTIEFTVSAPTTGWVGIGFGATSIMKDANIIIGYVKNGQVTISDQFGDSRTSHKPDTQLGGTNDIIEYSGSESNGTTELKFKIPLNSGDQYDYALTPGQTYKVIVAYGNSDDLTSEHVKDGDGYIKL